MTWNTKPTTTTVNQVTTTINTNGWFEIDVTQLLKDIIDNTNYGFYLLSTTIGNLYQNYCSSREGTNPPELIIISDVYTTLTGNDSNSGGTLASSKLTLYAGINVLPNNGNLHIGFGDFSAQTSFQINKTMNWVFDTSGGIGTITFPPTV